jgi:hypothetical protein
VGAAPEESTIPIERGDYAGFYRATAQWIHDNGPAPVDPRDAVAALEIIEELLAGPAGA